MDNHRSGKDLVKRTAKLEKELSAKTHELEIEAALEKVRTVAMRMNKPGDVPGVCKTLFKQFLLLGFSEMRNAMVNIHNDADKSFVNYDYSDEIGESTNQLTYNIHPLVEKQIKKIRSANDAFSETYFSGKDLAEWRKFRKRIGEKNDPRLRKTRGLYYYFYSIGTGSIGISTFGPISKEKKALLKRFRNVFNLSYQRYIDITKAEAQAREAQIEAALERMRASAMAMHNSDGLYDTAEIVYQELSKLGIESSSSGFGLVDEKVKRVSYYGINPVDGKIARYANQVPTTETKVMGSFRSAWKKQKSSHVIELNKKETLEHETYVAKCAFASFKKYGIEAPFTIKEWLANSPKEVKLHFFNFRQGCLYIIRDKKLTDVQAEMMVRFTKVFQLTYTRFLDLQKAEAQAREAQIETALERVRSRTMAMHRSEEIADILGKMFEELKRLDMVLVRVLIWIFNHEEKYISWWSANVEVENTANSYRLDYNEHPVFLACLEAWQKKVPLKLYTLSGAEKDSWQDHLFNNTGLSKLPDMVQKGMRSEGTIFTTSAISDYGLLMSGSLEPLSDENTDIIQRFGRVFQQSYTRYIDVQKAEAQTRESQIQLALERVRARTMAMQKSDELVDTAVLLFQQIKELGIQQWGNSFQLWDDDRKAVEAWTCTQGMEIQRFKIPATEDPAMINIVKGGQKGEDLYVEEMGGEALEDHYKFMYSLPVFKEILDNLATAGITPPKFQVMYAAYFSYGYILFITHEPFPEAHDIFKRFAKVFEQTYTRFLDLQKAEEQAREAKIEAALEKVRSRSLAMHKSDELWEVVAVVFEKFQELNFAIDGAAFITTFIEGTRDINGWVAGNESQPYPTNLRLPYLDSPSINDIWKAKESGLDFFSKTYSFEEKNQWLRYAFENSGLKSMTDEFKNWILEQPCMTQSLALGKNSILGIHFHYNKTLSETEIDILKRFSKVFDQAYIRFLDLQKAEAQAREGQIQLALERVRARTMAMQKSDELPETAAILFEQFKSLGQDLMQMTIGIVNEADGVIEFSVTDWSGSGAGVNRAFNLSIEEPSLIKKMYAGWKENKRSIVVDLTGKDLENWINYRNKMSGVTVNSADTGGRRVITSAFFSKGHLSVSTPVLPATESIQLLERFAQVFDLTYTRFLDLKKAEAQVREAQIEAALEKVRGRSLAMHKSEELKEVVAVVFEKLQNLKFTMNDSAAVIITFIKDSKDHIQWIADADHAYAASFKTPYSDHSISTDIFNAKESSIDFFSKLYPFAEKNNYFKYLFENTDYKVLPDEVKELLLESKAYGFSIAFEKNSAILIATNTGKLLSESEKDILKRFSKVFEQTYTRFLDLQKAEEQAKESQIQLAMERVRARTMAMQRSDELREVIQLIHQQLIQLNFEITNSGFGIDYKDNDDFNLWMADANTEFPMKVHIPYIDHPQMNCFKEAKEKGLDFLTNTLTLEEKNKWFEYCFENLPWISEEAKSLTFSWAGIATSAALMKNVFLYLLNYDGIPFSDMENEILKRFGKVFEQTYTRFLDLQKAEAQARESQIQLALERVRARTMAMQKSDELAEAARVLYEEFRTLNINTFLCGYCFYKEEQDKQTVWVTFPDGTIIPDFIDFPITGDHILNKRYEDWKEKKPLHVLAIQGEENKEHHRFLASKVSDQAANEIFAQIPDRIIVYCANFSTGYLFIIATELLTGEEEDVIIRFAKVFELTYTRFNDLKQAEAQAREAQIQLALERVRARTMAMQKSDELMEASNLLLQQVQSLGIPVWACGYNIWEPGEKVCTAWMSVLGAIQPSFRLPLTEHRTFIHMYESRLKAEAFYVEEVSGEELADHYRYMFSLPDFREIATKQLQGSSFPLPQSQAHHVFNFKHGNLIFLSAEAIPEARDIFKRFTAVFEQTYTRFLDLQKAEAQARQAQIEASLERVRASAMAMHRSDELSNVLAILFEQFDVLKIQPVDVHLDLFDLEKNTFSYRATGKEGKRVIAEQIVDLDSRPEWQALLQKWKKGKPNTVDFSYYPKEVIRELMAFFPDIWAAMPEDAIMSPEDFPDGIFDALGFCKFGYIGFHHHRKATEEEQKILIRFANEFERLYQRFLDLQKAEAQAREAQIELGLERVRARAMAMQKSDELSELVDTVFKELTKLDFALTWCIINIIDEPSMSNMVWAANPDIDKAPDSYHMKFEDYPFHHAMMKGWKERKTKYVYVLEGTEKKIYDKYLFNETEFRKVPEAAQAASSAMEKYVVSFSFSNFGGLQTVGDVPLSDANLDILSRFGKVFDLTYTRFNDLKQAEAQAREAQIEAALERVRSRTMAMQRSEELANVATVLFQQVKALGVPQWTCGFSIFEIDDKEFTWYAGSAEGDILPPVKIPLTEHPVFISFNESRKRGDELYVYEKTGEMQADHYLYMLSLPVVGEGLQNMLDSGIQLPSFQIDHLANFSHGNLVFITYEHFPEMHDVFKRFAKVFDQTYTRFLDLQKAEAQAREAQIEAALERVRSRSMGMQKSEELKEVIQVVYEQFVHLNIHVEHTGFIMDYKERDDMHIWLADKHAVPVQVTIPYFDCAHWNSFNEAKATGKDFFTNRLFFDEKNKFYKDLFKLIPGVPEETLEYYFSCPGLAISTVLLDNVCLYIENFSGIPYSDEENSTLMRFGKVFQQTYTRFLDLQRAEAQAREAKIETALEKVRSRTMAMQHSDELGDVAEILFKQVKELGIHPWSTGFNIWQEGNDAYIDWITNPSGGFVEPYTVDLTTHPFFREISDAKKRGEDFHVFEISGEPLRETYALLMSFAPKQFEGFMALGFSFPTRQFNHYVFGAQVSLMFITPEPYPEAHDIFKRFGKVFEQTYTRFLDLQKAEAQAREAQIEAVLEKVRSRTMGMQHSGELQDTALLLFQQILALGVPQFGCGFNIWDEDKKAFTAWMGGGLGENTLVPPFKVSSSEDVFLLIYEAAERGESLFVRKQTGEELKTHYRYMNSMPVWKEIMKGITLPTFQVIHCAFFSQGFLIFISPEPIPEAHDIFKRFAKVFEQTYTRFLDLQKAEAQAREAQIEAALERVRSRTMAMQRSDELANVATVLFQQVKTLGVPQWTCGFSIFEIDDKEFTWYPGSADGDILPPSKIPLTEHPVFIQFNESRKRGDELFVYEKEGEVQADHYRYMCSLPGTGEFLQKMLDAGLTFPTFQIDHLANFSHGNLIFITYEPFPEMHDVFKRFAKVFEQTYTRFLDLQKAEAQGREAIKRASVDRVRAEIASMRTTNDLERITPLIWNELTTLGVPFVRCGVFIMDEEKQLVETHLSTPDGKAIASFTSTFSGTQLLTEILPYWQRKEVYKVHWDEAMFLEQAKSLVEQGSITSGEKYLTQNRPTDLYLHFLPFLQGMLYAGNTTSLSDDELQLMQNLADAFSTAYARYEDFNKLEVAKQQIEKTLVDLKQAQQQLVQSEKMASLGELTAGIAHEIQNPLNFVNNFSDVNKELLEELKEEADKGNIEEIKAIANDVINNEEKINHHGKRADAIVKNMLQHSRSSGATKELTDINKLADEYLRLSYHGLRAKDKSFNADFKTEFDNSVGKINVIPQDIGRVILNVITNAFYAVNEKKKSPHPLKGGMEYKPTVSIITKKIGDNVEIIVADNGNGISQKNLDKIFQPFFTTKPTGQGTGLGLSLSYDIVKAHGGEIKVESKEGEGSEFVIQLPIV